MSTPERSLVSQKHARLAGLCYLVTIAAGLFAEIGTRGAVIVHGDPGATTAKISANLTLYRMGEAADVAMLICYLMVTVLLYGLFREGGRQLSAIAAMFSITGIAILGATGIFHLAPLALLESGLPPDERAALIGLSLDLHGDLYGVSLVFFGIYCLLIGVLAMRSRQVPHVVAALMMVGGACHLVTKLMLIMVPEIAHAIPRFVNMMPLLGEMALAAWLTIFGVRRPIGGLNAS
ncbi:hypothetical protein J3E64_001438 [Sphingobium sp. OAS761]|uniref:DUF4386 domain-containing protein n=1 Tax=Sphingobium sp. OAS761 TaxID=2817901 RepID=UPI0020A0113E|nr:DUF4386 domain-containing protein [Sphingobium sp. OAS761]MCP1469756.1 hypothetical protein [Sphingobium sp. OAS761]